MKKRVIAALAAVGLVAAMSGFGTLSAAADEVDETTTVVEETTTPDEATTEETTPEETTTEEESTEETTEEESTEETTTEETTTEEESTEEESTEEESTEEETTEEETTEEESTEEEAPAAAIDGFSAEQSAEAQAFAEANGLVSSVSTARFVIPTVWICEATKWGWEPKEVGPLEYAAHFLFHDWDIMPGYLGLFPKNLDAWFGGLTGQQIYDNDCSKKVYVEYYPEWESNEYCWDGYAQPGSLSVYYSSQMEGKAVWVITDDYGFSYEVPYYQGWNEVELPAGYYDVELVSLGGWYVKHGGPYEITIWQAINCGCTVNWEEQPEATDKLLADVIVEPLTPCAEAEVSVTPPTCEAASTLVLGETFLAEWGDPEYDGSHYTVTAYADEYYRFYPGEGVPPDGSTKTFEGDLAPKLTNCGGLPVTGAADPGAPLWLAGLAVIAGIGALVVSTRRGEKVTAE